MTEVTEGHWDFVEGEPGFMGSLEEPPEPPYPPVVIATLPDGRQCELAQLCDPIPEDVPPDPVEGDPVRVGSAEANGRRMAAAQAMYEALSAALPVIKELPAIAPPGYPIGGGALEPLIFEVEEALKKADGGKLAEPHPDQEHYFEYKRAGGLMQWGAWHRVWRQHMQYIDSDRISPFEGKLLL